MLGCPGTSTSILSPHTSIYGSGDEGPVSPTLGEQAKAPRHGSHVGLRLQHPLEGRGTKDMGKTARGKRTGEVNHTISVSENFLRDPDSAWLVARSRGANDLFFTSMQITRNREDKE